MTAAAAPAGRDAGTGSASRRLRPADRRRRRHRRRDRARRGAARAGRRAVRRGRLRRRDLQPVVQADPRRPALPAVRRPAPGLRGAGRAAPPDAHGAAPVPAGRVPVPGLPRRDARRLATLGVGIALYNALALWRPPARGRTLSRRASSTSWRRTCAAPGLAGAHGVRRLPDRRRPPGARERPRRGGGRRDRRQPRARRRPSLRDRRGRVHRRRARGQRDRRPGCERARDASCVSATGPFTDSFLAEPARHRLRPTLGVHLVFDAARVPHNGRALVLRSPRDNRLFFVLPAGARTIVGHDRHRLDRRRRAAAPRRRHPRARRRRRVPARSGQSRVPRPAARGRTTCCRPSPALRPLLATSAHTPSETSREHDIARAATACWSSRAAS